MSIKVSERYSFCFDRFRALRQDATRYLDGVYSLFSPTPASSSPASYLSVPSSLSSQRDVRRGGREEEGREGRGGGGEVSKRGGEEGGGRGGGGGGGEMETLICDVQHLIEVFRSSLSFLLLSECDLFHHSAVDFDPFLHAEHVTKSLASYWEYVEVLTRMAGQVEGEVGVRLEMR